MQKLFLMLIMTLAAIQPYKKENNDTLVVLELFTSQGCSSCPPADKLLEKINTGFDDSVISLSYHVDYWNYIGWKDPFSKKEFSDKQRAYGQKFLSRSVYTPQVVVNGKEHFVGSNKKLMYNKLKHYLKETAFNTVEITDLNRNKSKVDFDYEIKGDISNKTLRVSLVIKERVTYVKRGENRNRTLKNTNIVVEETYLKLNGAVGKAHLEIPDIVGTQDELLIVVIVETNDLDITGGKQIAL